MKLVKLHVQGKPILLNVERAVAVISFENPHKHESPHYSIYETYHAIVDFGVEGQQYYVDERLEEIIEAIGGEQPLDKLRWLDRLRSEFDVELQQKTGWGRNEVKQALGHAIDRAG